MNDREGQPKDYEARERRTMQFIIGMCVAFLVILIGVDIGVILLGGPVKEIVLGIIFTLIIGAATGLLIAYYNKRFVSPNINDTDVDQKKAAMYSRKDGEDMFAVCERYRLRFRRNSVILIAFIAVLVIAVICLNPSTSYLGMTVPPFVMAAFYIILLVVIAGVAIKANQKYKSADDLRKELYINGFDPDKVNRDFMHGSTHRLPSGFLVIGQDYYVVYKRDEVHVCAINDITEVKGVTNIKDPNADNRWHIVHITEKNGLYSFGCSNDLSIETIVDEFRKKGLITSYNSGR